MMDVENIFIKCAAFTLDACLSYVLYSHYRSHAECLKSLKEAPSLELDAELKKTVQANNGTIQYAAISGRIEALQPPLSSQYMPHLSGVIREKITVERKVKWNPFLGIWGSANNDLLQSINYVPFCLSSKSFNLFKRRTCIEVLEPLTAKELVIPTVYDDFHCHHDSFGDAVFGVIRGEKTIGIQDIERLLCEGETLTAVGKIYIENNTLKIGPPDDGLTYFLTPLSLESLIQKLHFMTKVFKVTTIIASTVGLIMFMYLSKLAYDEIKLKIIRKRDRKKFEEEMKLRKISDKSRSSQENVPKCIVCLDNPCEIIILECGHVCLCFNCSERIQNHCPVCRNVIYRKVPAFLP